MPQGVKASNTTSFVYNTPVTVASGTGATGGEQFQLWLDTNALSDDQYFKVQFRRSVLTGGTTREVANSPFNVMAGAAVQCSHLLSVAAAASWEIIVTLLGVTTTTRSAPWSVETPDKP